MIYRHSQALDSRFFSINVPYAKYTQSAVRSDRKCIQPHMNNVLEKRKDVLRNRLVFRMISYDIVMQI